MDPLHPTENQAPTFDYLTIPNEPKPSLASHFIEFFQTLVVFAAIASSIYLFIAQPHKVSGQSMFPNFHDGDYIITDKLTYRFSDPKRGDVIVFKNPQNEDQDFIKRIMAKPGDKVKVLNGNVYVNGKLIQEPYLKPEVFTEPKSFLQEGGEKKVEPNQYIVMGDNRMNSSDSRVWGPITKQEIIGKVLFRYWPKESIGLYPAAFSFDGL